MRVREWPDKYIRRHKVPISLDEAKRVTENCNMCALWKPRFSRPPGSDLTPISKPWERLSMTLLALNQWLEAKTNTFPQGWMRLVGFPSPFLSRTSRLVASSSVFRHFLLFSEPLGSFKRTGARSSSHPNSKISAAKMELRPPKLRPTTSRAMAKTSASTELCGRPFSASYSPQNAHSLTGNVSYHQRSHRFEHLSKRSQRRVPMIASLVSNVASRLFVPQVAHFGSEQTLPHSSWYL